MPKKYKTEPLTSKDIKLVILDRDETVSGLARRATEELGYEVTAWQMRAVIHRFAGVVYPDLRAWLAAWIGCDVSQVGREPARPKPKPPEAVAA